MKIINVVGARPNFMKIAPIMAAYRKHSEMDPILVHTGQHYDTKMCDLFFKELGIPEPDLNLGVGSGSHAAQTAAIMIRFEEVISDTRPDTVLVVGDVNSTIACGLVPVKLGIKLVHVEAGLRSFDRTMPEEINRILTDSISDLLFCTEQSGVENLLREGIAQEKIHLVGNVMIDTLMKNLSKAESSPILSDMELEEGAYSVLTLHRPSNVDDPMALQNLIAVLEEIQANDTLVFPVHPRTRKNLQASGLLARLESLSGIRLIEPLGYLDFLKLISKAKRVLTDSGGIQEETTILGIPCLTLRESTERPVTVDMGTNQVVGTDKKKILSALRATGNESPTRNRIPPLWDGRAAERIVDILIKELC